MYELGFNTSQYFTAIIKLEKILFNNLNVTENWNMHVVGDIRGSHSGVGLNINPICVFPRATTHTPTWVRKYAIITINLSEVYRIHNEGHYNPSSGN